MTTVLRTVLVASLVLPLGGCLHWPEMLGYHKKPDAAVTATTPVAPTPAPIGPDVIAVPVEHVEQENMLAAPAD